MSNKLLFAQVWYHGTQTQHHGMGWVIVEVADDPCGRGFTLAHRGRGKRIYNVHRDSFSLQSELPFDE